MVMMTKVFLVATGLGIYFTSQRRILNSLRTSLALKSATVCSRIGYLCLAELVLDVYVNFNLCVDCIFDIFFIYFDHL